MENEITIDGKVFVLKSSIKSSQKPVMKKGLTYCIVRTYSAGVFAGWFDRKSKEQEGTVYEARRLWYWDGAASLSQLAIDGVSKPQNCKFPEVVAEVDLKQIIEVLPCSDKAIKSIASVGVWKQ